MGRRPPQAVIAAARAAARKFGIPASVSLAQWALESAWGARTPPGSNNPFGMKVRAGRDDPFVEVRTREVIHGTSVFVMAKFRKFSGLTEAFEEHARLLAEAPVYAKARAKLPDTDAFADALTGVYATDPDYGRLLKAIMRGSDLYQYDY